MPKLRLNQMDSANAWRFCGLFLRLKLSTISVDKFVCKVGIALKKTMKPSNILILLKK